MGIKEEHESHWGWPARIVVALLLVFLIYRFGGWIIYGIQSAGKNRDITISLVENSGQDFRTKKTTISYFVDLENKKIYMEKTTDNKIGNKYIALSFLNNQKKRILAGADLSTEDIKLLVDIASDPAYKPRSEADKISPKYLDQSQQFELFYETDRIQEYGKTLTVYRYDIETILDNFDEEDEEESGEAE